MDERPVGIFDSGFGGLTVLRAISDLMPHERLVYFGDSARYPYGPKSREEVSAYSLQ
ncbi:MAG: glutamate racemase, partial [Actinomycetota bacterium]|nr:glutamate racemase [Actinomycetota bacterium]